MSLPDLLVPTYRQMLKTLSAWLEKARTQMPGDEGEALVSARLAPDMFPLATQVRFACVQALEAVHRLRGEEFPASVGALREDGVNKVIQGNRENRERVRQERKNYILDRARAMRRRVLDIPFLRVGKDLSDD